MSTSHEISFEANGVTVDAEYTQFAKSGRLRVQIDGRDVAYVEWMDYSPDYFTDKGLKAAALSEVRQYIEFAEEPSNFGEGETPDASLLAISRKAVDAR